MRKLILSTVVLFASLMSFAQNNVGIGTAAPSNSALLDLTSTSRGLLIPRMTTNERTAIASPAKGLLVFDNSTNSFWFYNGTVWTNFSTSASLTLPLQQTVNSGANALDITNSGIGGAIRGVSNAGNGIGVYGESLSGNGIKGFSSDAGSAAVFGSSVAGTGVYASSFNGNALEVNGRLKISGGNTNPSNGAVLTSDADGNAVWKSNRIAFKTFDYNSNYLTVPSGQWRKLYFANEGYDLSNQFTPYPTGNAPTSNSSVFTVSINGVYHFESHIQMGVPNDESTYSLIRLRLDRNGSVSTLQDNMGTAISRSSIFDTKTAYLNITGDFLVFNGDKIFVEVFQFLSGGNAGTLNIGFENYFSGNLVNPF